MIRFEFDDNTIHEENIHPESFYEKEQDFARRFLNQSDDGNREEAPCPVCGPHERELLFSKWGYDYSLCPETWTVSLSSAVSDEMIAQYHWTSELARYRASQQYQELVTGKRTDLWESLIGWMEGRISRYLGYDKYLTADWGSRYTGWIQFLNTAAFIKELQVIEPLPPIKADSNTERQYDIICLLDVMQRESKPLQLLERIGERLKPGGLLIASCRAGSGFDVLTLKEGSSSIFPLDHIMLPSPEGMNLMLEKTGFEVHEITTPGLLDMKLIRNNAERIAKDQHFLRYIMAQNDELLFERMQGFLQRNNLSSHLRCVARKK